MTTDGPPRSPPPPPPPPMRLLTVRDGSGNVRSRLVVGPAIIATKKRKSGDYRNRAYTYGCDRGSRSSRVIRVERTAGDRTKSQSPVWKSPPIF